MMVLYLYACFILTLWSRGMSDDEWFNRLNQTDSEDEEWAQKINAASYADVTDDEWAAAFQDEDIGEEDEEWLDCFDRAPSYQHSLDAAIADFTSTAEFKSLLRDVDISAHGKSLDMGTLDAFRVIADIVPTVADTEETLLLNTLPH